MNLSCYKRQTPAQGGGLEDSDLIHQKQGLVGFLTFAYGWVILDFARNVILLGN